MTWDDLIWSNDMAEHDFHFTQKMSLLYVVVNQWRKINYTQLILSTDLNPDIDIKGHMV